VIVPNVIQWLSYLRKLLIFVFCSVITSGTELGEPSPDRTRASTQAVGSDRKKRTRGRIASRKNS
jgi:hypothetical protein